MIELTIIPVAKSPHPAITATAVRKRTRSQIEKFITILSRGRGGGESGL